MKYPIPFHENYNEVIEFAHHYGLGYYDGRHRGESLNSDVWPDLLRHAYKVGYDSGVADYCRLDVDEPDEAWDEWGFR